MTRLRDAWDVLCGRKYATTYKLVVRKGTLLIESGQPLTTTQADEVRAVFNRLPPPPPPRTKTEFDWVWRP